MTQQEQFIKNPNLPRGRVTRAIVSGLHNDILEGLRQLKITPMVFPVSLALPKPVCDHADMLFHHLGDNSLLVAGELPQQTCSDLRSFGTNVLKAKRAMGDAYPEDCLLNGLRLGRRLFCNRKAIDEAIIDACEKSCVQVIHVNQGYTRCSSAIVNEHALITSDNGLARAAALEGIDVLKIEPGNISLPGYLYGFIGGACGLVDKNSLAFAGELKTHPEKNRILGFIRNHGVQVLELCKGELRDIGGILPLTEEVV